jgi:hypothetical protein
MAGSLSFSGGTDRVDSGSAAGLDNVNVMTWMAWICPTSAGLSRPIMQKGGSAGKRFRLFGGTSAGSLQWTVAMSSVNGSAQSAGGLIVANAWRFVACTYDALFNPKIFLGVPGGIVSEVSYGAGPTQGTGSVSTDAATNMLTGGDAVSSNFPGRIAFPRAFNRVMLPREMTIEMYKTAEELLLPARGCVLSHLFTGRASSERDFSGRGNVGTITGAVEGAGVPILRVPRQPDPLWANVYNQSIGGGGGGGPTPTRGRASLLGVGM